MISPSPKLGRAGVGEASEGSWQWERGFPLPNLPRVGGGDYSASAPRNTAAPTASISAPSDLSSSMNLDNPRTH